MSWTPQGVTLLVKTEEGRILITILTSLARELARMQTEIDELRNKTK